MYIQMFILKRAAFLLEETQMTQFHHQNPEQTQQGRYFDEANTESGN